MIEALAERGRVYKYESKQDAMDTIEFNDLDMEDAYYLAAIRIPSGVVDVLGTPMVAELPTRSLKTFFVEVGPTGYYQPKGGDRIVFINEDDLLDYDLISELHSTPDADVYIAANSPWEAGREVPFVRLNEWFRDETYTDHFAPDENDQTRKKGTKNG